MWHNIWIDCGNAHTYTVADIMCRTRLAYHYAIRYNKRNRADIIKQRFADNVVENRNRDFWHEGCQSGVRNIVDGHSQASTIAHLFADKYEELYTYVDNNDVEMSTITHDIDNLVATDGYD